MAYRYGGGAGASPPVPALERIRGAAVELFGEHGFTEVSLKMIAARAGVSAPLVIHHYGSKTGLREACDRYVAEQFRRAKTDAVEREGDMPQNWMFQVMRENRPLVRYMFRSFAAGGPEVDRLVDQLVEDSLEYTSRAEELGQVRASRHPRHRAAVLLLMSFGSMMLHQQMKRLIGTSPVDDPPEEWGPYIAAVSEIYLYGVLRPEAYPDLLTFIDGSPCDESAPDIAGTDCPSPHHSWSGALPESRFREELTDE